MERLQILIAYITKMICGSFSFWQMIEQKDMINRYSVVYLIKSHSSFDFEKRFV